MKSRVADASLAGEGEKSYWWAYSHMPTLTETIKREAAAGKPLEGRRVAACLHVTKETSVLVMGLRRLGAEVQLAAANPLTTQDEIAAYLSSEGVGVHAWREETADEYWSCIRTILDGRPDVVMDDGGDTHATVHEKAGPSNVRVLGGTEETTTGVTRLKALEAEGRLLYPIVAVNNAYTKYLFDNRYGTGQSFFDGLLRATSLLIAGKRVVVCGYGWVGRGIALRARGLGAIVYVTEVDPVRALEAYMDGFETMPLKEAAKLGDIFVTATGQTGVVRMEHIQDMKDGAILANAGHFDVEIDVKGLDAHLDPEKGKSVVRPHVEEYHLRDGKRIYLIGKGRIANLVAAEGHPPEVMSFSFSNQLLSVLHLVRNEGRLEKRVHDVPEEIDRQVAVNALKALGIKLDEPTEEQIQYAKSWALE